MSAPTQDRPSMSLMRPNTLQVDLDAVANNIRAIRHVIGAQVWMCVALKGNAYGFGLIPVAYAVQRAGADAVSVADVADAVALREQNVGCPILLYPGNLPTPAVLEAVERHDLMPTIIDDESARVYASARFRQPVRVFIKVDVGLERLGIRPSAVSAVVRRIARSPSVVAHGIYTHFDVVDDHDAVEYLEWQFGRFSAVIEELKALGIAPQIHMAAASGALAITTSMNLNAVDPGHLAYGLQPAGPRLVPLNLKPAFKALRSRLIHVKDISRDAFLDKLPFPTGTGLKIGVIPMGRRDGLATVNAGAAIVRGCTCPIGSVDLEHTRIDLTGVPDAEVGDDVVLIGSQHNNTISLQDVATHQSISALVDVPLTIRDSVRREHVGAPDLVDGIPRTTTKGN